MIFEKLQKARVLLQNKKLKKSGKNDYAGFTYFELADFLPAINEIFEGLKLYSKFSLSKTMATLKIIDTEDKSFDIFYMPTAELQLKGCNSIQALGGTNTYLRRYLYLNALEIVDNDLFDKTSGKNQQSQQPKPQIAPEMKQFCDEIKKRLTADEIKEFVKLHGIVSSDVNTLALFFAKFKDIDEAVMKFKEGKK